MIAPERPSHEELARLSCAWDWVLRLRGESPDQKELNDWLLWYESDERNKQAFDQARAIASQAPEVMELQPAPPLLWQAPVTDARSPPRRRRAWLAAAIAAGLSALVLKFGLDAQQSIETPQRAQVISAESVAEQKQKETFLPDGSRVELASKSAVELQYSDKARLLNMSDGVAYFTVAHNHERPFIVRAGDVYVRAIGTAFNVRHSGERVVVTVTEGIVDLYPVELQREPDIIPPPDALRVGAGKEVVWVDQSTKPDVTSVDPAHALAWREGRLEYLNEPLASAIADINRYSSRKIIIRDSAIGKLVFSGAVVTDSADIWVDSIPALFPVDLLTDADGNVVLVLRKVPRA